MPIGKLFRVYNGDWDVEWKIYHYLNLKEENGVGHQSPWFSFEGESWNFVIWPIGSEDQRTAGFVDLGILRRSSNGPPMNVEFSFSLKSSSGQAELTRCSNGVFEIYTRYEINRIISKSDLQKRHSEFLPAGSITIICTLKILSTTGSESDITTGECSYCKETFGAEIISLHEKKCRVKCPQCLDIVLYQNWNDHECGIKTAVDEIPLCEDLKEMLLNGLNHDLVLKVGNKELRAHRDILRTRSQVFKSMLDHDMKEKNSGVIDIPDCDLHAMEQFLCYIYTGKVELLNESNMLKLYYIADKYDMKGLKGKCSDFIRKSLSNSSICEVVQLALNHSDSNLLEHATEYFKDNTLDIMSTVEWQSFLKDNSTVGNELMMKSFQKLRNGTT